MSHDGRQWRTENEMKIPKRFYLFGRPIEIEYRDDILNDHDCHGQASYRRDKIILQPILPGAPQTQEQFEHTFCHELVHHITYYAGQSIHLEGDKKLHSEESFIDLFAALLHQALTTSQYEDGEG
jgi:hypothetical protein